MARSGRHSARPCRFNVHLDTCAKQGICLLLRLADQGGWPMPRLPSRGDLCRSCQNLTHRCRHVCGTPKCEFSTVQTDLSGSLACAHKGRGRCQQRFEAFVEHWGLIEQCGECVELIGAEPEVSAVKQSLLSGGARCLQYEFGTTLAKPRRCTVHQDVVARADSQLDGHGARRGSVWCVVSVHPARSVDGIASSYIASVNLASMRW